jgi:hypothetical protein
VWEWGCISVVEHFPSIHKALGLISRITGKEREKQYINALKKKKKSPWPPFSHLSSVRF